ncbi:MAG TPA: Holliday junction branch migration protein RuvA [Gemmatimonadetes bacterium]|jgi:Holliday junction DNA helicase RuvA|nr:Holliday junction branch migration protein RuvA [Gemmatimonadota bacterium]HCW78065.1 Holliday junction branch migration protein RuvA [Gemmatimonadota bacterium]
MISRLQGTLLSRDGDWVEIETKGGVVYEVEAPLSVIERLPSAGGAIELRTVQVVSETSVALYGFIDDHERSLFRRLLTASGVGAKVALAMMSTYSAGRLARALVEKDTVALQQISGIGKKKAEKIALDLADKVADLAVLPTSAGEVGTSSGAEEAVQALIALGYSFVDADKAVREVLQEGVPDSTDELIRRVLAG